jgi:hypothetical protein
MYCYECGSENADFATRCSNCGASFGNPYQASASFPPGAPPQLNNYLVPAIFATMCCCLPFGIVSIVYAAQVNGRLAGGDIVGATDSARNAKIWFWIAFGIGILPQLAYVGIMIAGAIAGILDGAPR